MPNFKRLVAQVHDIEADSPEQADEIARIRAQAVNTALKPLGHGTAWAAIVTDEDCGEGGLTDILAGLYLLDEDEGCVAHVPAEETVVPERLIAWRDAAVKAALDAVPVEWEWGTRDRYGIVMEAGRNEKLARMRLDKYPEYVAVVRRRARVGDWEDVVA